MSSINPKMRALSVLVLGLLMVGIFLNRLHLTDAEAVSSRNHPQVTVERLPSSEARSMGVDNRNH